MSQVGAVNIDGAKAVLLGVVVTLLSCVGCGNAVGPTSGVVKFDDGSPVSSGSIEFRRVSDRERFASRISSEGEFRPADEDGEVGLPPGSYEVVVVQIVLTEDLAKEAHSHGNTVPRRYADYHTSGLTVDVSEGQIDPIQILIASQD